MRASWTAAAILVAWLVGVAPTSSDAQTGAWREMPPPPLAHHAVVFDPARNRMLVIGGAALGMNGPVRVWSVTMTPEPQWSELRALGATPPHVPSRGAVYDPLRDRVIVYCGFSSGGLWSLDLSSPVASWSPLAASGTPHEAITDHAAVYDPVRDRMLVFGGLVGGGSFLDYTNQVSELSLSGGPAWSTLSPNGSPPLGRGEHEAIFDPVNDRLVVFGGRYQTGTITFQYLDETWALSLSGSPAWSFLAPSGTPPAARIDCSAVFDPVASRIVIVGGRAAGPTPFSDAWALDLFTPGDAVWNPVSLVNGPPARYGHAASLDPTGPRMLIYGGQGQVAGGSDWINRTDLWSFELAGSPVWTLLPNSTLPPRPVRDAAGAMDPIGDRLLIFGGNDSGNHDFSPLTFSRALTDDEGWTTLPVSPATDSWIQQDGWFDAVANRFVTYGGSRHNGVNLIPSDATLGLTLPGGAWTTISPTGPGHREYPTVLFDSARRRLLVFGGFQTLNGHTVVKSDAWALDLSGPPAWTPLPAIPFGGRYRMYGIYDSTRDRVLLMGGRDTLSQFDDVHALDLENGTWAAVPVQGSPPPFTFDGKALFDATRDRVWCLLGLTGFSPDSSLGLWALDFGVTSTWSRIPIEGRLPTARSDAVIVLDSPRDRIVMHGGSNELGARNETWALYLDKTTPAALSLADISASSDRVRVRWFGQGRVGTAVQIHRRTLDSSWRPVGERQMTSDPLIEYVDTDVHPGERLGYRLGTATQDGAQFFGEAWVEIPGPAGFRLFEARPNPTDGPFRLEFELPDRLPATLQLLDVAGRRRFSREVGDMGRGRHVLPLDVEALEPGLYWARLLRAGSTLSRRVAVIR